MLNRTYIQMLVSMYKSGNDIISESNYFDLERYYDILEKHPELVEYVVRHRIDLIKQTHLYKRKFSFSEYEWAFFESMIIGTWEHEQMIKDRGIIPDRDLFTMCYDLQSDNPYIQIDELPNQTMTPKEYGIKLQMKKNRRRKYDYKLNKCQTYSVNKNI